MDIHAQADELLDRALARLAGFDGMWQLALDGQDPQPEAEAKRDAARTALVSELRAPMVSHVSAAISALGLPGADQAETLAASWVEAAWADADTLRTLLRNAFMAR